MVITLDKLRIVLCCYGGGHVQSLVPVYKELIARNCCDILVVGFSTARQEFEKHDIPCVGYDVFEPYIQYEKYDFSAFNIPHSAHPSITDNENSAYYHVGIQDLIRKYGADEALAKFIADGRICFEPDLTMEEFLLAEKPDIVVSTTSPRSELAIHKAAKRLGIKSVAVSDLFLIQESKYICASDYASDVTVISDYVKDYLLGFPNIDAKVHVTGNPAFDQLFSKEFEQNGAELRQRLGIPAESKLITWIGSPGGVSLRGLHFADVNEVAKKLSAICEDTELYFGIRPHPNSNYHSLKLGPKGHLLDNRYPIESVVWASDVVVFETSTVGLQAALIGKFTVAIGEEDYPPYQKLGLSVRVSCIDELTQAIHKLVLPSLSGFLPESLGVSAKLVSDVILEN